MQFWAVSILNLPLPDCFRLKLKKTHFSVKRRDMEGVPWLRCFLFVPPSFFFSVFPSCRKLFSFTAHYSALISHQSSTAKQASHLGVTHFSAATCRADMHDRDQWGQLDTRWFMPHLLTLIRTNFLFQVPCQSGWQPQASTKHLGRTQKEHFAKKSRSSSGTRS